MYSSHQSHQFTVLLIASYITLLHIPKIISNKIFRSPFLYYLSLLFFTLFFFYPRLHLNLKATYRIPQYSLLFQFKDPLPSFLFVCILEKIFLKAAYFWAVFFDFSQDSGYIEFAFLNFSTDRGEQKKRNFFLLQPFRSYGDSKL